MRFVVSVAAGAFACTGVLAAGPEATFLGGRTFAVVGDCAKIGRVAEVGGTPATPLLLTAKGYSGPDGVCRFTNIDERYAGRIWTVSMVCTKDGGREIHRSQVWRRLSETSFAVTEARDQTTWAACTASEAARRPRS